MFKMKGKTFLSLFFCIKVVNFQIIGIIIKKLKNEINIKRKNKEELQMVKKVAILANGGDVSGFNAVIRAIVKTAEQNGVECYGFIDGYRGLLKNDYVALSTSNSR